VSHQRSACSSPRALPPQPRSNCQRKCGQVDIPYPFGIGSDDSPDHFALPGFNLCCIDPGGGDDYRPFFIGLEVLGIFLQQGHARMRMTMFSYCYNTTSKDMDHDEWYLDLTGTP
jgi:hypothetical protein